MRTMHEIKNLIEETREELNTLVLTESFEKYYEKSKQLDALIEEYLDMQ